MRRELTQVNSANPGRWGECWDRSLDGSCVGAGHQECVGSSDEPGPLVPRAGHQGSFCMLCVMQNHMVQAFANSGNAIKPVSFIRDLKSKSRLLAG